MEEDLKVLKDNKERIEKGQINFKKSPKERITLFYVEARLEALEQQYSSFIARHESVIAKYDSKILNATDYIKNDDFQEVCDSYLIFKADLKRILFALRGKSSIGSNVDPKPDEHAAVKLPKITIPTFSGKYTEWCSFRDLFISLVDKNPSIDNVQKLHYLKAQVTGEAEQLIKHLAITDENYTNCWKLLTKRYDNKRFLSNCILKRLFSQRNIIPDSASSVRDLLDTTTNCLHELNNLGINTESWDVIINHILCLKLDVETRKQWEWEVSNSTSELPTFDEFAEFLESRFRVLESIEPSKSKVKSVSSPSNTKAMHVASIVCPQCSEAHRLYHCKTFAKEDVDNRRNIAQQLGVCFNCFGSNHNNKICRAPTRCRICKRKHHTLLHLKSSNNDGNTPNEDEPNLPSTSSSAPSKETTPKQNVTSHFSQQTLERQVLLPTALIKVQSKNGDTQVLRALIDQGSQASFIAEAAVQLLRLNKIATRTNISGLGGGNQKGLTAKNMVLLNIQSLHDSTFKIQVKAHVLRSVTSVLPEKHFSLADWPQLQCINLADPQFNSPNKIDLLLGAEVYCQIMKQGFITNSNGPTIAQDTYLGWIISGKVDGDSNALDCHNVIVSMHTQVDETDVLRKFWELEAEPVCSAKASLTAEEKACEDYFAETTCRDETGRYIVKLPFRTEDPLCKYGNSRAIAVKRLQILERKLQKNPDHRKQYAEVINEYLTMGHMEKVSNEKPSKESNKVWLPHTAVIKEDRKTTKTRVVFDASAKGTNGVSLHDTLMVRPTLLSDLRHLYAMEKTSNLSHSGH